MDCSCGFDVDVDNGEFADFHHSKRMKSSKEHICDECEETIIKGDKYEYVRLRYDKNWHTHRTCPICLELRDHLFINGYYYGIILDTIREEIGYTDGVSESCIAELSPPAREVLCGIIEETWEDR